MKTPRDFEIEIERRRLEGEPLGINLRIRATGSQREICDAQGRCLGDYEWLLKNRFEARDYVPYGPPPDWPGVVLVMHPAAWSSGGAETCEALAKRFRQNVHVLWHGTKWYWVFVGEPAYVAGKDVYNSEGCQWWAVVHPNGVWKNLASS